MITNLGTDVIVRWHLRSIFHKNCPLLVSNELLQRSIFIFHDRKTTNRRDKGSERSIIKNWVTGFPGQRKVGWLTHFQQENRRPPRPASAVVTCTEARCAVPRCRVPPLPSCCIIWWRQDGFFSILRSLTSPFLQRKCGRRYLPSWRKDKKIEIIDVHIFDHKLPLVLH